MHHILPPASKATAARADEQLREVDSRSVSPNRKEKAGERKVGGGEEESRGREDGGAEDRGGKSKEERKS